MEEEGDGDTNSNWCTWNNLQKFGQKNGRFRNQKTSDSQKKKKKKKERKKNMSNSGCCSSG